jgi:hypothetical protein
MLLLSSFISDGRAGWALAFAVVKLNVMMKKRILYQDALPP